MDANKNRNLETKLMNHNNISLTASSRVLKRTHEEICMKKQDRPSDEHVAIGETETFYLAAGEDDRKSERSRKSPPEQPETPGKMVVVVVEESGREKLKRHRVEMSGRVWIPDIWGQEDLLKKWIDCTVFDSSLEKTSIMSAREGLIQEGRSTMSIENSC